MTSRFHGLWPAVITPLTEDGKPAFDVLEKLTDLFVRQGLDGLYLVGSTGQWPLFTLEERRAITECVVRAASGRIPVMVHVGAATTEDAVTLARHAARTGADAISAVTPIYYPCSADAVFEYYRRIGSASELPLFAYHLSGVSQMTLSAREYVDRLLAVPRIAGMKITDFNLYTFGLIHSYAGDRLQLFSGADEVMCHAVLSGAVGAIGTFYNLWGPVCRQARQAFAAGAVNVAQSFMLHFQTALDRVIASGSIWSFLRAAMRLAHGLDVGMPRPPLGSVDRPWSDDEVRLLIEQVNSALKTD
jgi:dihydrodipicolinate synthase/N-acetylneuraminate lyase